MSGSNKNWTNPFDLTKANALTDQQIHDYWVEESDILAISDPTSPKPMFLLGGKGSGKTHLMRYFSYELQAIRYKSNLIAGIVKDGYLGVYFRCSGLNAIRFTGKKESEDRWNSIFRYFMELWFAQLTLEITLKMFSGVVEFHSKEEIICNDILNLFDEDINKVDIADSQKCFKSLADLIELLSLLQKKINIEVNNYPFEKTLNLSVLVTQGKLIFGIPKVLTTHLNIIENIQFLYLVDEFENLTESQQKYINTLIRETQPPCSFRVGSRLYGIKTKSTFCDDEDNKEESEYKTIFIDSHFRKNEKQYIQFAKKLCAQRLKQANYNLNADTFTKSFEMFPDTNFADEQINEALSTKMGERIYFKKLEENLEIFFRSKTMQRINSIGDIKKIIDNLRVPEHALLEKFNILLLYKDWNKKETLLEISNIIREECKQFLISPQKRSSYKEKLDHSKNDLLAQLLREYDRKQLYLGVETFIKMSDGLPRNLLVILKHIFSWSIFNGEKPFQNEPISKESQQKGIKEASEWFYDDAQIKGQEGVLVHKSISRLATFLREIRFSDKPSECSLSSFSCNLEQISDKARNIITLAEKWSLLIRIEHGRRDRNTRRIDAKYQINKMLAPYWDLPIIRRGIIAFNQEEITGIFDPDFKDKFEDVVKKRVSNMKAPFFGRTRNKTLLQKKEQLSLFPMEADNE